MKSRAITNLILFIALILLIGFIALKPDTNTASSPLTNINKDSITEITIHREDDNIIVKKIDQQWHMTEPHNILAHDFRIQSLLGLLETNTDKHYETEDIDLKTYGLQPPRAHIQFNDTHIYFGKTNPVTSMRYIQLNNKMYLMHDELYPLIRSQPTSFVDLVLLPPNTNIAYLKLPELELVKSDTGWKATAENSASADQIQVLLQNWNYAKAFAVHAYIKRKSLGTIKLNSGKLNTADANLIEFQITDTDPWLILARPELGIEYHLDASQKDKLLAIPKP